MKFFFNSCFLFFSVILYGQYQTSYQTIYKPLIPAERRQLLKDIDVIFNSRFALDNRFSGGEYQNSDFSANEFRLEIKGKIHEKVYFRFRDRYTGYKDPLSRDMISRSTDMAFISVDITSKNKVIFGKLYADWGGYEIDANPIDILEYNDVTNNEEVFVAGIGLSHQLTDKHLFNFQVLNARSRKFEDVYAGYLIPEGVQQLKSPLGFVANWRGSFFDGKFETIYSYSHYLEARNRQMNLIVFGNKYQNNNFKLMYDFLYSNDALDRKLIATNIIDAQEDNKYIAQNVAYLSNWIRMEYLITPKINLLLTLMTNNTYWNKNPNIHAPDKLYTSYGYIPTIEFIPLKDFNLRFYLAYVGRNYNYTSYAQNAFGQSDYNTGRFSFGFIAPLLIL